MITRVPKQNWKEFLDNISQELQGWEISVEVISDQVGAQTMAAGLPFNGLTVETQCVRARLS